MQDSIPAYLEALEHEIDHYKTELGEQDIKTIYFWWGTPNIIWFEWIDRIIKKIQNTRNVENLAELSLEFNPYPMDQIYDIIKKLNKAYKNFPRVRFSFGIQSLDDEILKRAGRPYNFVGMTQFLRWLRDLKQENNVFNFDFITFGKFKPNGKLRDDTRINFFTKFVQSQFAESFSLYTLEQHQGTARDIRKEVLPDDENIMKEFEILKKKISNFWYQRYEISNFCRRWCASIHNMVYRNMENYLWLWVSASSLVDNQRWTNTTSLETYLKGERKDDSSLITLDEKDILIESFFLKLRTAEGISDIAKYGAVLVDNYSSLLIDFQKAGLLTSDWTKVILTDSGMDVSNSIITDLLKDI
jgi:oxygen-independent coproporphyrinogen III oxidase